MNKHTINTARRGFLRAGAACATVTALGALGRGRLPFSAPLRAAPLAGYKRLVIVNLVGGNDGLNTVFPAAGAAQTAYLARRPGIGLAAAQGLSLAGGPGLSGWRLHPALDQLQAIWNAGQLAIVSKVGYPNENLSHFVSEDIWSSGARNGVALSGMARGWIARYANAHTTTSTGVVSVGMGRKLDFEGANLNPLLMSSAAAFSLKTDSTYDYNHILRVSVLQQNLAEQPAGDLKGRVAAAQQAAHAAAAGVQAARTAYLGWGMGATYPTANTNPFTGRLGPSLRDIASLIYGGFDTRIYYTGLPGGFDTHSAQEPMHTQLLTDLDDALAAFRADLMAMNVWNDTAVLVVSEFGRRNYENGSAGSDHGHGNFCFVLGGAVSGGLHGDMVTQSDINAEYLPYTTDFRDVYRHMLEDHLGHSAAGLFPESQPISKTLSIL
ncbi:MAG: DUF1501 domain-containing protein [Planctomycetes bacterium]|jgi:uncharacterized protein (DUF1501 family)|nr:DUF1501 domain-containing protein [Planctomycetota bacterium]MCL4730500.1 DUF1501 domain-containing protein [Planctomycetota bacterium]